MGRFVIEDDGAAAPGRFVIDDDGAPAKRAPASTLDRVMAVPAGVNRGIVSGIGGLPVDTMANIVDLAKIGIGGTYSKAASFLKGKEVPPPDWTLPADRRNVIGSGAWIADRLTQGTNAVSNATGIPLHSPVEVPRPDDKASRYLFAGGEMAGSTVNPNPAAKLGMIQQAKAAGGSALGGLLSQAAVESGHPEWAGVASMAPAAATATVSAATKQAIRGGEEGRQKMAQRMADLKNGGIDQPSAGLASGNRLLMGMENLLAQAPFISDLFVQRGQQNLAGMQGKAGLLRDAISSDFGPVVAGQAIQSDLKGPFKERIGQTYGLLNDRVEQAVGPDMPVPVTESVTKSGLLTTPVPGAEATSSNFINPRIAKINRDLQADAGGRPAQVVNSTILGPDGLPAVQTVIPATNPQGVPFSALKDLRTKIGKEAASNAIMGTPEQGEFKQLYGAMSQDMKNGVALADLRNGTNPTAPGSATTALNRANDFYSKAMTRAEDLNGVANRSTPEGAYNAVANSLNAGPTIYEKLRGAVTPQTRQKIVATVIDDLGRANPGQQGAAGDTWSPKTFLTNFSKLNENGGGDALFKRLPGGQKHAEALQDIAKAAEMVGDASKVWNNPSGTAAAVSARTTAAGLTFGAFLHPILAGTTAGGLALNYQVSKRLLLNPKFVNWLAEAPKVSPDKTYTYMQRLIRNAPMWGDKQFGKDVDAYLQSVDQMTE